MSAKKTVLFQDPQDKADTEIDNKGSGKILSSFKIVFLMIIFVDFQKKLLGGHEGSVNVQINYFNVFNLYLFINQ